jgi:hypothetical protein
MRIAVGIVLLASLLGCKTVAPEGSDAIRVTRNAADVEHCKTIGAVQTVPPYALPGDDLREIRNRTVAVGADTVLLNASRSPSTSGVAYRCRTS